MLTVTSLLLAAALICTLLSAASKLPIWIAVLFLGLIHLVERLPLR